MADDLDTFISGLQTKWGAVTGISLAPDYPIEEVNAPGTVLSYVTGGRVSNYQAMTYVHQGRSDVFIGRASLPHDEQYARPYILRGLDMFAGNMTMGSTCEHCTITSYEYGALEGSDWLIVRFNWEAKIQHTSLNVAA